MEMSEFFKVLFWILFPMEANLQDCKFSLKKKKKIGELVT